MAPRPVRRVAVIAYHSSPLNEPGAGDAGGMTIYVRRLASALARRGIATDIFTRATSDAPPVRMVSDCVRVISIEAGPRMPLPKEMLIGHVGTFVRGVDDFSARTRASYDIVHSHYWQSGLAALELASAWDVPLVHSAHTLARVKNDLLAPGDSPEPARRIEGELEVMAGADVLIASTDAEWQQLSCLYGAPHDRLKIIHPGVDHGMFAPGDRAAARARVGLGGEDVMLYVGRIQPLKGLELAIEALARLPGDAVLLVAGGPSGASGERELERLKARAAALGLVDRVRFAGPQPHDALPDFYRAADVLVVCSHSESFGLSALEAQACGTPVVGTAVGGLSYVVADGASGYLLGSRDPDRFAQRVGAILSDEALRDRLSRGAVEAAAGFSWEHTASGYLELYDCLASERAPEVCTC